MTNPKRLATLLSVLALAALAGAGCSAKARQARLLSKAAADFAAEHYEAAEVEYKGVLRTGAQAHAFTQLGILYFREGRVPSALYCLKKAEELDPKAPDAKGALSLVYAGLRDPVAAFREAKATLALQSTNTDAMLVLAESAETPAEVDQSKSFLQALPGHPDRLPEFHSALATLDMRLRDFPGAQAELQQALALDPKSPDVHFRLSQMYGRETNITQATNELKTAVSLSPWRSIIRLRGVDLTLATEGEAAARQALKEITSHAPDFVPAWVDLMRLDFASKQLDDCKKTAAIILQKDPDNFEAALETGIVLLAQGDATAALASLQRTEAHYGRSPEVKYYLGAASLSLGEQGKARQYLSGAISLNTNYVQAQMLLAQLDLRSQNALAAVEHLQQLVHQQPTLVEPRLMLAEAFLSRQEYANAMAVYRDLLAMRPKDPQIPYLMGLVQIRAGNLPSAQKAFERSLELAPDYAAAVDMLADVEVSQKHYDSAAQMIQREIEKYPTNAPMWLLMGKVDHAKNQDVQSEAALKKAIQLDPSLTSAYVSLSELYEADHKDQQALDTLNSVLARTNDPPALMALGELQQRLNHLPAARDAFEKLVAIDPTFAPALNNLAYLYAESLGDLDKAYVDAQKARDLRPNDPNIADTLGWILYKRGDFPRALALFQEAAAGQPGNPEVQLHLGLAYYMLDNVGPARDALQTAANSTNAFPSKDDARQRLAVLAINPASADDKTASWLEDYLQHNPADPIALACLAEIDSRHGAFDKAAHYYEEGLKTYPKNTALMDNLAALYADRLNRPDDALKLARNAHDLDGNDPAACAILGRLSYAHGDFTYAAVLLERAASSDSATARTMSDWALALYALGKVPEALAEMEKSAAQSSGPDHDASSEFLALVQASQSSTAASAALPQAQAALQKNPHNLPALMVCAVAAQASGDPKGAEAYDETALASYPQFSPALRQSAILCAALPGKADKAFANAEKAHAAYPDDPDLNKILGREAYGQGDYSRSAQLLQAASGSGLDGESLFYLGMDYYKLKRNSDSKRTLEKALTMNLASNFASDAKRALSEIK